MVLTAGSAPDDHLRTGPHRRVEVAGSGRERSARDGYPAVCRYVVTTSVIQESAAGSTPDDHLRTGPHRRVARASSRRVVAFAPCVHHASSALGFGERETLRIDGHLRGQRRRLVPPPCVERSFGPHHGRDGDSVGRPRQNRNDEKPIPFLLQSAQRPQRNICRGGAEPGGERRLPVFPALGVQLDHRLFEIAVGSLVAPGAHPVRRLAVLSPQRPHRRDVMDSCQHVPCALFQLAVKPIVPRVPFPDEPLHQRLPPERFRDEEGIVPERRVQITQHLRVAGVP